DSGVLGSNEGKGNGVTGASKDGFGVRGDSTNGFAAVHGHGGKNGVFGFSVSETDSGVLGSNEGKGNGVTGASKDGFGVRGDSANGFAAVHGHGGKNGVFGFTVSENDSGVLGSNEGKGNGVTGASKDGFGVRGDSATGIGVLGKGGRLAGRFEGDVEVTGHINTPKGTITCNDVLLAAGSGDCAEEFDSAGVELIEPGTVVVFDEVGAVKPSHGAYDRRVAGIVSGAGDFKPAIILDRRGPGTNRLPIALLGKVYCKVDAQYSAIKVGDLLTTSPTAGHAMKASDPLNAFGAVIGKALRSIESGHGLIPVLVSLQ
ncbi:MAG: hypothetical protein WAV47_12570, partial [Blastocatellia bacterium]